ncbi:putative secreted protein [Granulibacter bethesdensis]|uniref:Secreted protein n=1 Tax=Granulibacter bethesdensis TaxID=364410 RepID=A0AAC9KBP6_9PROT|nr:Rap1a/Tai family immunity protein [Granulibacter bethesdensis]APH54969.1 putative secreted protein [Granulibacter bethesdensis]APH62555.1 putative secreted protein [Granulibacter bethesdensis]
MSRFQTRLFSAVLACTALMTGLSGFSAPAHADFLKRKVLLDSCLSAKNERDCTGYIAGIADAASDAKQVCIPAEAHLPQVKARVLGWLKAHKENPTEAAAPWVKQALTESFPCK